MRNSLRTKIRWIGSSVLIGFSSLMAQEIPEKGIPWLENYQSGQYHKHGKIWDIAAAPNGMVYMAGDAGLLEYDGQTWTPFKGSKGSTRSLFIDSDSLLYSGSDLDFGCWTKNRHNQFVYTSLYPFGGDVNLENEEFWDVCRLNDNILFISFNNIYVYKKSQLIKIAAPVRFSGSFWEKGKIYVADEKNGLYEFNGVSLKHLFAYPSNQPFHVAGIFETDKGLLMATKNSGLFLYQSGKLTPVQNDISTRLKKDQVFCATKINDAYFAFGTILNGLYITDPDGNIVQHINKQKGLPNNTILSMHYTPNGMLWLGMDYGISAVHLFNNLTYFFDFQGNFGTPHAALLQNDQFYLGTNQGLYQADWRRLNHHADGNPFVLVPGSEGQVWSLQTIQGKILCGHDKGLFAVEGNAFRQIHREPGVWTVAPFRDNFLLTGNYNGISVFQKKQDRFHFLKKVDLILGSCNELLMEQDTVFWVNIPNYGLIRFALDDQFFPVDRKIFPAASFAGNALHLERDERGIQLLTTAYRYLYDAQKDSFSVREATTSPKGIAGLLDGVYMPLQLDARYQLYPVYNGFALRNTQIEPLPGSLDDALLLRKMEAFNNQTRQVIAPDTVIPYAMNNLRFHFVAPHRQEVVYQYQLSGYAKSWSEWTTDTSVDFLNLAEGKYTFKVRANIKGRITDPVEASFRILPPWYRSRLAWLGYLALSALLVYLIRIRLHYRLQQQKKALLEREQLSLRKQAEKYRQEALLQQQQQLEDEKKILNRQVIQKSVELVKQARENKNKNQLLHSLKEKMDEVQHDPSLGKVRLAEMQRLLDLFLETDDRTFEIQMDELHQEFFKKLREQYPDLSLYDLRLCGYLKIGLNSKEISEIMKVLPSSINVSRSRLRKKLHLQTDDDLYVFLNQV
ncbi:MAG: triple tyrosine motif-containing protein [Saprospiraceae bacterium]|nr:triple tyrosine motif-containing protein [Saprospiraceae bacterium]